MVIVRFYDYESNRVCMQLVEGSQVVREAKLPRDWGWKESIVLLVRLYDGKWWVDDPVGDSRRYVKDKYQPNPRNFDELPLTLRENLAMLMTAPIDVEIKGVGTRLSEDTFWVYGWEDEDVKGIG